MGDDAARAAGRIYKEVFCTSVFAKTASMAAIIREECPTEPCHDKAFPNCSYRVENERLRETVEFYTENNDSGELAYAALAETEKRGAG